MTKQVNVLSATLMGIALVAGPYLLSTRWVARATTPKVKTAGKHPPAPDFTPTDINGAKLVLSDYKGKVVLLDFWASWCGPCRIETPWFVEMQNKYRNQGFTVLGSAHLDTPDSVRKFYRDFHLN